jgi:DNA-binding NtrC family response regulator
MASSVTATATYSNGTTATVSPTWSSSDTGVATVTTSGTVTGVAVGTTIQEMERDLICSTLEFVQGNRRKAAKSLGIGERTLYRKIQEYGLRPSEEEAAK